MLGGVEIPHDRGLSGHSDADALVHALCDAMLGAANLGDLGAHFPETPEYRDVPSLTLLERVRCMTSAQGYRLSNADCIVHAEEPRIAPYRVEMARRMAAVLGVEAGAISIKATRGEGMGPVGERTAIAATVVVLLERLGAGGAAGRETGDPDG